MGQFRQATRMTEGLTNTAHEERLKELGSGNLDRVEGRKLSMT